MLFVANTANAVVLLPAFSTEDEREISASSIARYETLTLKRDFPPLLGFERCVGGVTPADELVEPKCEDGESRSRVRLPAVAREELILDLLGAAINGDTGQSLEILGGTAPPRNRARRDSSNSTRSQLGRDTEV